MGLVGAWQDRCMRFSDQLREASEPAWSKAVRHRFTDEVIAGTVGDEVMRFYLVQDYQFVDRFVALLGGCVSNADRVASRLVLARQLGVVAGGENDYFRRAFDTLGVPESDRAAPELAPVTRALLELMDAPRAANDYAGCLAVLTVAEWLYADWAARAPQALPKNFVYAEWVELHRGPEFSGWVDWLRAELDRLAPRLDEAAVIRCRDLFIRATELELAFFGSGYP